MGVDKSYPYYSKIFLELIPEKKFKILLQAAAPEIYADIESTHTNPNCTCRSKVDSYINNNKDKLHPLLIDYLESSNRQIDLKEIEKKYKVTYYAGRVDTVKISEWGEYTKNLQKDKAVFRSFSVIKLDNEHLNVFFI